MNDKRAVEEANTRFYRALADLDVDAMEAIWLHEDWVACVHPGWPMITGWDGVRESWVRIFENTHMMNIAPADVDVRVAGSAAWVNCTENISTFTDDALHTSQAQATNLFLRVGGEWKVVVHHASPVPVPEGWNPRQDLEA